MHSRAVRFLVFRLPALIYMGFIFWMSSGPIVSDTLNSYPDYVLHALGYSVLYLLLFWAFHEGVDVTRGRGGYWVPTVVTTLYGISDELHQYFVPGRDSEVKDVAADIAGAMIGIAIILISTRLISPLRANRRV